MRASDADRERVVDVLRLAAGDGRLTPEELDDRLGAAPSQPGGQPAQAPRVARIDQHGGTAQRTGAWLVPRRLKLRPKWCRVTLDFTETVITHDALDIDMNMRGGALILVTVPGMTVDADRLSARYGAVNIRPRRESGVPAASRSAFPAACATASSTG